jgi:serine/threonine protein kinase
MPSSSEDHGAEHFDFDKEKGPTINVIEGISTGGEAVIDEVEVQDTYQRAPFVCVRRSYIFHPSRRTFQSLKNAHLKEVAILKKLINQRHFIELLGSYTKDAEKPNNLALVILQNPRADCDLASLLDKTPENRQAIISDGNLERGIACLASALYFLHSIRIRHKDIASKNILVHGNQLLFADFGLSMDFSELSNSETCSFVNQQPKYRPPEGYHGRKHTCASDVFSLGCVFFEILTTLSHANTESYEEGKSDGGAISEEKAKVEGGDEFQDVWPYRDHLKEIYRRLEKKRKTAERQASTQRLFWLKKTEQMLAKPLGDRIKMFEILLELWQEFEGDPEGFAATACESCQNHIKTLDIRLITEPMNVDFEAEPNKAVPVSENPATGSISSESQQNFYHRKSNQNHFKIS